MAKVALHGLANARAENNGDGSFTIETLMAGARDTFRDAFEALDTTSRWTIVQTGSGDLARVDGNAAAASYLVVSKSPLATGTETIIESQARYKLPLRLGFGAHMSQRTLGQEFSIELVSTDDAADVIPLTPYVPVAIASISQATTTLTVNTAVAHGLTVGDRVETYSVSDSRLNYSNLVVATIPTPTQFTATAGAGGTIASVTAGPFVSGFVAKRPALGYARNGISMIFENATATNASIYTRSEAGDASPSGTVAGNHSTTIGTTASVQLVNVPNVFAFAATNVFEMLCLPDGFTVLDYTADTVSVLPPPRAKRTRVVPNPSREYKLRIRARNSNGMTAPVAKVVSAAKSGSTTATIVTDQAHGLTTGDVVFVPGIRDQTNFVPAVATVASIVNATSFTVVFGASVTATSYGGSVYRVNGGATAVSMGALGQYGSAVARAANIVTLTGNAAWSGVPIGDYVNLHGVRDNTTGADLGLDGMYRVVNVVTTALTLEPLAGAPTGDDIGSTNCGGTVIRRTDLRLDFVRIQDFNTIPVEAFGGLARQDAAAATGVLVMNSPTVTAQGGTAIDSPFPNPNAVGARAANANPAAMSAAGDLVGMLATMIGAVVQKPYAIPEAAWNANLSLTTTTAQALAGAAGAGLKRHVTALQAINTGASAVDLILLDGATERWRMTLPVNVPVPMPFPTELLTTANAALNANLSAAGTVRVCAQGYTAP